MKKLLYFFTFIMLLLSYDTSNAQANVLDPSDPDVIFTSTNQPAYPTYAKMSKWGHTNRLSWNPYSYGFKSYYFKGMAFRVKFPKSYMHNVADGKVYPAIIFLHGLGESGNIWDNEYQLLHGGQTHAQKVDDGTFDGFLIYPQSQNGYLQSYFPQLKDLADSMAKYVKLDPDRLHIGGLSGGGQATWDFPDQQLYAQMACALEPISAARYENVNYFASHITIPVLIANGGQDVAPYPATVTDIINSYKNLGGNITQAFFPTLGHGAWDAFWADPRYWPFINAQHKANPLVFFQHNKFCPGDTVNAQLGLQAGFYAYQWESICCNKLWDI
jgi:pimeloyl-ACP methyl ester carboxylesterase